MKLPETEHISVGLQASVEEEWLKQEMKRYDVWGLGPRLQGCFFSNLNVFVLNPDMLREYQSRRLTESNTCCQATITDKPSKGEDSFLLLRVLHWIHQGREREMFRVCAQRLQSKGYIESLARDDKKRVVALLSRHRGIRHKLSSWHDGVALNLAIKMCSGFVNSTTVLRECQHAAMLAMDAGQNRTCLMTKILRSVSLQGL